MRVTWIAWARLMILAALPLGILAKIPDGNMLALAAAGALLLGLLPISAMRIVGLAMLLWIWAMAEARQMVNSIEQLSAAPVEASILITEMREDKQQLTAQLIRIGDRYQFPPLFITLNIPPFDQAFCAGQRWQAKLQLRAIHARLNVGEFDLQRFALSNHTPLQGRIASLQPESLTCDWRTRLLNHHAPTLSTLQQPAILQALAFGIRTNMTEQQRKLLRETGIAHLMAISGMHIALAASVGWILARGIQIVMSARRISYVFPLLISVLVAMTYCWVSGSHAPAQRAMLALILWVGTRIAGLQLNGWQIWTLCIGGLLWIDPLSTLSESFWLSAVAVAMLLIWYQWFGLPPHIRTKRRWLLLQLLHLQLGMMILMAPLQIFLFQGISLSALLANLIAVPVVSFITVPVILLAMLMPLAALANPLWQLADISIETVMQVLMWLPAGWWGWSDAIPAVALVWIGLLLWRSGLVYRAVTPCLSLILAILLWRSATYSDDWQIDMIDVGHGLAIAITQGDEVALYDSGPGWKRDDAGSRVIVPWLQYHGRKLHSVFLSHTHLDHRGGLKSLRKAYPNLIIRSALADSDHLPCHRGQQWQWLRLQFTVLWPPDNQTQGQNNDSCVVRVDDGKVSLLLTGDIELEAERKIVALEKRALAATLLQVPHHGSRTSSGSLLLRSVAGEAALASVARYNAWRLPATTVVERYRQQGYIWYDTAQSGQIHVGVKQGLWQIKGLREQLLPRWYHQWFGVKRDSR